MLHDTDTAALYKTQPSPEMAAFLASMAEKVQAPKRAAKKPTRKPKAQRPKAAHTPQHDAHAIAARPFLGLRTVSIRLGHDPQPLSYFASPRVSLIAEVCRCERCHPVPGSNPPLGPEGWGLTPDAPQLTSMGPGFSPPGIRRA